MIDYTLCSYACTSSGIYLTGSVPLAVFPVDEYEITDCRADSGIITVRCPEAGSYTLCIAGYDKFGKLEKTKVAPFAFKRGKAEYRAFEKFGAYPQIKVILWDESIQPLCQFYEIINTTEENHT